MKNFIFCAVNTYIENMKSYIINILTKHKNRNSTGVYENF